MKTQLLSKAAQVLPVAALVVSGIASAQTPPPTPVPTPQALGCAWFDSKGNNLGTFEASIDPGENCKPIELKCVAGPERNADCVVVPDSGFLWQYYACTCGEVKKPVVTAPRAPVKAAASEAPREDNTDHTVTPRLPMSAAERLEDAVASGLSLEGRSGSCGDATE